MNGALPGTLGSLGDRPYIFRELGRKLLILGSWGALLEFDFPTCFLASPGKGGGCAPDPLLQISILLFQSILLAKSDFRWAFSLITDAFHFRLEAENHCRQVLMGMLEYF